MKKVLILLVIVSLFSCKGEGPKDETMIVPSAQETAEMNKVWIQEEQEFIDQFVARKNWDMQSSKSGLKYLIYKQGKGDKAEAGMKAMVDYTITLLDGSEVYSTKEIGPQAFHINQDHTEVGIHEAITYLRVGDRAKLIIPPYLAHGLMGDQYKIPPMATLVFDIRLLGLSQ
ncbi:FKBP-type peptidyl-prolyl cis-trans isomerase [Flavobacteriales bacterium]|nr:FKBP-type peptidyl-prolyl cis-trans isomerase [Flavobacteriales bacterium]